MSKKQTDTQELSTLNVESFKKALIRKMPFGKYQGTRLIDLPEPYLVWFSSKGFPNTQIGRELALIYEIKLNGLESMFE